MSDHHYHQSAGRFTILIFYYSISIGFQAKAFASRVTKPERRTTIFTGRPSFFASRVAKPECRTTIFTGQPDGLLFYYFISIGFKAGGFLASRTPFPACRFTLLHVGQTYPYIFILTPTLADPQKSRSPVGQQGY